MPHALHPPGFVLKGACASLVSRVGDSSTLFYTLAIRAMAVAEPPAASVHGRFQPCSRLILQNPNSLIFVAYVNITAPVHDDILCLKNEFAFRHLAKAPLRFWWKKITHLNW